jgi:spore coat protein U-like protein
MRSTLKFYVGLIASSLALSMGLADAATVTSTLAVSATVNTVCVVNSVGAMAFGAYTGIAVTSSATLNYTCSNALPVQISFDKGVNGASTAARLMKNAASTLSYQLYSDSARTTVWDDTTNKVPVTGTGASATQTIYGQIPAGQYPTAGAYTDTVTITLTY